jgi:hypothetical protein
MKKNIVIIFACALLGAAEAQMMPGDADSARSSSGQFVVFGAPTASFSIRFPGLGTNNNFICLEAPLLAVSCERIKQAMWRELDATASWQGKIFLSLRAARFTDEPITIISEKIPGGWDYRVALPDVLERNRFIEAMMNVLLLEMANRNAGAHGAEIPAWLAAGLAQELIASDEIELILPPPRGTVNGLAMSRVILNARKTNSLARAQNMLNTRPPLTYEELSWPTEEQLSGDAGAVYRSSAQVFVNQLLHLKDGPACLRAMLDELPRHYNWQIAFLNAFQSYFQRPLDVEKWWALQVVQFTGRDLMQMWTPDESWRKLDEVVHAPVQVRAEANELPLNAGVTLQTIIRDWDAVPRTQTLQRKLWELELLRLNVAQNLVSLVDEYRQVVGAYLKTNRSGFARDLKGRRMSPIPDDTTEEAIKKLDDLDARREALRPSPPAPVAAAGETTPSMGR